MAVSIFFLVAGASLLIVASDRFVEGAAGLALRLQVSSFVVGAVVMGFGTSVPELLVSTLAAAGGSPELGYGNIIGSNLANLSLVLGLLALVAAPQVPNAVLRRQAPIMAAALVAFALMLVSMGRWQASFLLVLFIGAMGVLLHTGRTEKPDLVLRGAAKFERLKDRSRLLLGTLTLGGLVGTVAGAYLLVSGAQDIARSLGLAEGLVGFTIVAVGTTLPEIAAALQAARRSEPDFALGNVFGSNMFNSLASGGVVGLVSPEQVSSGLVHAAWVAVAVGIGVGLLMWTGGRLRRWEGAVLLAAYLFTIPLIR